MVRSSLFYRRGLELLQKSSGLKNSMNRVAHCTVQNWTVPVMPSLFYRTEQNNNRTQTWLYRLGGWLAIFLGLTLLRQFYDISNKTVFLGIIVQTREELRVSLILNAVKFLSLPWTSFPASVVCLLFKSAPCPSPSPSPSRWAS